MFKPVNTYGRCCGFTGRKNVQSRAADLSTAPNIHCMTMNHVPVIQQKVSTRCYPLMRWETKTSVVPPVLVTKRLWGHLVRGKWSLKTSILGHLLSMPFNCIPVNQFVFKLVIHLTSFISSLPSILKLWGKTSTSTPLFFFFILEKILHFGSLSSPPLNTA